MGKGSEIKEAAGESNNWRHNKPAYVNKSDGKAVNGVTVENCHR